MQPNQQIVAKSLAAYWNGQKEKIDEWMQDWLAKRQPAALRQIHPIHIPRPVHSCNAITKTMPKTGSGPFMANNRTRISCTLCICQLTSATNGRRRPTPTSAVTAANRTVGTGHAAADATPEAAEARAPADMDHKTDLGSDGC